MDASHKIIVFQEKQIRRVWHNEEWFFSVVDVIEVLTDSTDAKQYIKKMRSRDPQLNANWGTICTPLRMPAPDGKMRETNAANAQGIFRIVMSVPSPKAEPFKLWLAQVGKERLEENKTAARKGGQSAGKALKAYEKDTGKKVVSASNFKKQLDGGE